MALWEMETQVVSESHRLGLSDELPFDRFDHQVRMGEWFERAKLGASLRWAETRVWAGYFERI